MTPRDTITLLQSPTRTGHLITKAYDSRTYSTAFSVVEFLDSVQDEYFLGRVGTSSAVDELIGAGIGWRDLHVEPYSGAIWYCSGSKLFINYTD